MKKQKTAWPGFLSQSDLLHQNIIGISRTQLNIKLQKQKIKLYLLFADLKDLAFSSHVLLNPLFL